MRHLKSYTIFENFGSGNTSFDFLKKQNNERFFKLTDILYSEIFDDFDIFEKRDETFDGLEDPTHKFWGYNLVDKALSTSRVNNKSEISDTDSIKSIFVYNIREDEATKFYEALKNLDEIVFDYCEKHLVVTEESYVNNDIYFDYIISLGDKSAFYLSETKFN